jgi:beta-RFAP synthase
LGVGTQLGLAVARALACATGREEWDSVTLARHVGRGERSAIGVHGFARGGLIVEAGKGPGEAISPLVAHYTVPRDWQVLLLMPTDAGSWHGQRERSAFAQLQQLGPTPAETEQLCRLVLTGLLPALSAGHFDWFSAALYEFNARVGDIFAAAQGGRYGSPALAHMVQRLRALGVQGVGQSSWGPTIFAFVPAAEAARVRAAFADVPTILTAAATTGAQVWTPSLS